MKKTQAFLRDGDDRTLFHTARSAREAEFDALFHKISYKVGSDLHARLQEVGMRELAGDLRGGVYSSATDAFIAAAKYLEQHRAVLTGAERDPQERDE